MKGSIQFEKMVNDIEIQSFKTFAEQQLQDANVKREETQRDIQGNIQHADDVWTQSDSSMTVRLQTVEQEISQLEASSANQNSEIDSLKMTIDSTGHTIRGINKQLLVIHE